MFIESHLHETLAAVADDDDAVRLVELAVERMAAQGDLLDTVDCRLAHGDLSPDNVLVDSGRISGIVDWEAVKGAPQANDFAWWATVSADDTLSCDRLLAGYRGVAELEPAFWPVFELAQLRILTVLLGFAARLGDTALLTRSRERLRRTLSG